MTNGGECLLVSPRDPPRHQTASHTNDMGPGFLFGELEILMITGAAGQTWGGEWTVKGPLLEISLLNVSP